MTHHGKRYTIVTFRPYDLIDLSQQTASRIEGGGLERRGNTLHPSPSHLISSHHIVFDHRNQLTNISNPPSKRNSEYFDPCQEAADKSLKCLRRNGGDRLMCTDYFE